MPEFDIDKQFKSDCAFAEKHLVEDGEVSRLFILRDAAGKAQFMPARWGSDAQRGMYLELARTLAIALDARSITTLTEGWSAPETESGLTPSQSDLRREVLCVTMCAITAQGEREVRMSIREILRGADAKPTGLGPEQIKPSDKPGGELLELLPPDPVSPEQQRAARAAIELVMQKRKIERAH